MNGISGLWEFLAAGFLVAGAAITLIGTLGLLRFRHFNERVHAPTLGTTLGTAFVAIASMIYFWAQGSRPVVHEMLIVVFIAVTTPISLVVLVRAAILRDSSETRRDGRY
ncbi:MAG TPA: monovalent cation/H(+) antiporter subunit G [Pseudolabrys sp.]|jgi:multicomponent K+:H+ antiporter subunit G|nr:monovalent cation/H(+) antiporter subunit G [Pseudolabrys sp.]